MSKVESILEGLHINEGSKFAFRKYYGCELSKDLGNLKKGTKFYCSEILNNRVGLVLQNDKNYELILPISFAETVFTEVGELEKGKKYTLKIDLPYMPVEYCRDFEWSDEFINKYTKKYRGDDYIYFSKGTKFQYVGADMSGDSFIVDGEYVDISDFSEIYGDNKDALDFFK